MPEISWISPPKFDKQILNELQRLNSDYEKLKFKTPPLNERATGQALVEPLLEILGWTIRDLDEVYPEYYVTGSGRVDYVLKINRMPVVYIEIKKLDEDLEGSRAGRTYAEQAMDYAWKKKATWAVLTNFKELRLYNAKEHEIVFQISYLEYLTKFESTLRYLAKDAVLKGDIGQLYAVKAGKEIEDSFLNDLQSWRLKLANSIHLKNEMNIEDISTQTEKILNRLTLIRIAEDRGSLPRGQLQREYFNWKSTSRSKRKSFFQELEELFLDFEFDFNTELFKSDTCDYLIIENSVFDELIKGLYDYDFSTLTGDILGSTYELYLGYALEPKDKEYLTKSIPNNVPLELVLKKEYRQRKGIFYTRPPVVDFIVSNTVLPQISSKNALDVGKLKILDCSGGSGSFLIKAMTVIRNQLVLETLKARKRLTHKDPFYSQLAVLAIDDIPKFVLKNNIYLVDLDPESVEIAKLNLWAQSLHPKIGDEKVLFNLENNFKCGNTLFSTDSDFGSASKEVIDTEIKPFDWEKEFPDIFPDKGQRGFDAVIGNPPYYSIHSLEPFIKGALEAKYKEIHTGQNDILYYFYEKGIGLLREGGLLGFITAKYFLQGDDSSKLREWILNNCKIRTIVDFGNTDMFGGIGTRTAVMILEKCTGSDKAAERATNIFHFAKVKCRRWLGPKRELISLIEKHLNEQKLFEDSNVKVFCVNQGDLTSDPWELISQEEKALKKKIENISVSLDSLCHCCKGMDTGLNDIERETANGATEKIGVFHLTKQEADTLSIEPQILKKLVKNSDIDKYLIDFKDQYLIYATNETNITAYPNTFAHLERFEADLKRRYGFENDKRKWYEIATPRHRELIDSCKEKLICPYIASENKFAYDNCSDNQKYYGMTDTTTVVPREENKTDLKFILGVLNSALENFYYKTFSKAKDYRYEYFAKSIKKMRIPDITMLDEDKKTTAKQITQNSVELLGLTATQNELRKCFIETLKNNLINDSCTLMYYFKNSVNYCFQKTVVLSQDVNVESSELELFQEGNIISIKAYFEDKWQSVLLLEFNDQNVRDFVYLSIDQFLKAEELSFSWRRGKIINDVILGIKMPKFENNDASNLKQILNFMAELRSKACLTELGEIAQKIRSLDRNIDEKVYAIYDINDAEKAIIEEAIDFGRPYLRY